ADSPAVRRVPVPAVEHPDGGYDLIAVFVRAHQVDAVLESLAGLAADVRFPLNWAAGPEPLGAVIGRERVLLSFPTDAGTMDRGVVRYRSGTRTVPVAVTWNFRRLVVFVEEAAENWPTLDSLPGEVGHGVV